MSTELARLTQQQGLSIRPSRRDLRVSRSIDNQAALTMHRLAADAEVGRQRIRAVTQVGTRALEAQSVVSMTERMIVEMEPGAVHGISYLSQRLTIGLGQVLDKTIDEVCS